MNNVVDVEDFSANKIAQRVLHIGNPTLWIDEAALEKVEGPVLVSAARVRVRTVFQDIADYPATKCKSDDTTIDMDRG